MPEICQPATYTGSSVGFGEPRRDSGISCVAWSLIGPHGSKKFPGSKLSLRFLCNRSCLSSFRCVQYPYNSIPCKYMHCFRVRRVEYDAGVRVVLFFNVRKVYFYVKCFPRGGGEDPL